MNTRSKNVSGKKHDRSAMIQWVAIVIVAMLGLIAAFVLADGSGGGGNSGAPAIAQQI